MELQVGINSYITLEEVKELANDYILIDEKLDLFNTLSDKDICRLVNSVTKKINKLPFKGKKETEEQLLEFPRVFNKKHVECPEDIKIAIVLQAVEEKYSKEKDEIKLRELGVSSYSVDGASISFKDKVDSGGVRLYGGIYKDIYVDYIREHTVLV